MTRLTDQEIRIIQKARSRGAEPALATDKLIAKARWMRAGYVNRLLQRGMTVLGLDSLVGALVRPLRQAMMRGETVRELRQLDDHMLRDIGLERSQIEEIADALAGSAPQRAPRPGPIARLRKAYQRRATIAALENLDDRVLSDIGLVRGNIARTVDHLLNQPVTAATSRIGHDGKVVLRRPGTEHDGVANVAHLRAATLVGMGAFKGEQRAA